jgi:diguanylate cyclase (GGDEF)-like protein
VGGLGDLYELRVAKSGSDALALLDGWAPDLILLDVMMPDMDGYEVCARLQALPQTRATPIIFITSKDAEEDETRGLDLGAVDYVTKPFSLAIVQARIRTHLELKRIRDRLEQLSLLDGLTGLPNRRHLDEHLALAWSQAQRTATPLSAILMDVDHFKAYNDTYGHQAGDACLQQVAAALAGANRRGADLVARYGGEEFAAILPSTDLAGGVERAEALRAAVEALRLPHAHSSAAPYVTVSLGVARALPPPEGSAERLLEAADHALYQAKHAGRNRVGS